MDLSAAIEPHLRRVLPLIVLIGALLVTMLAYWPSREFSLFLDDAFDLNRIEDQSTVDILFQPVTDYGYHRPVTFLLFKTNYDLFGEHNTTSLRTLGLALHAVSGWILYLLARRLELGKWAIAAAALFLLFPFSYQTLNIIGAMGHVLVVFFTLSTLILWLEGRSRDSLPLQAGAIVSGVLAAWSMEYGVISLPLILGLEFYLRTGSGTAGQSARHSFALLGLLVIAQAVYLAIWLGLERGDTASSGIDDIARNGTLWLQSVAYPGTRFLNYLLASGEPVAYRTVILVSALILAAALTIHAWLGQVRVAALALGTAFACFLPAMLMLTHEYVIDSPRLLYVSSPAIAVFWALLGRGLFTDRRVTLGWQVAVGLFVLITLWHSHSLIERRFDMFRTSESVVSAVVEVGNEHRGSPLLVMNTPSWFSFHSMADQEYPLWHLGVQGIPPYVGLDGLYYAATGESATIESAALAPDVSGWDYAFGPHGPFVDHGYIDQHLRAGYMLSVMSIQDDVATVHQPGNIQSGGDPVDNPAAVFAERIALNNLEWRQNGKMLDISTTWNVFEALDGDYQIQIEALDADGMVVFEHRNYALNGMSPPRLWQPGDLVSDFHQMAIENSTVVAHIEISIVNTADQSLLKITEANASVQGDNRVRY